MMLGKMEMQMTVKRVMVVTQMTAYGDETMMVMLKAPSGDSSATTLSIAMDKQETEDLRIGRDVILTIAPAALSRTSAKQRRSR